MPPPPRSTPPSMRSFSCPSWKPGRICCISALPPAFPGMYQQAMGCVQRLRSRYPERKILCIDTLCASLGEGFLVREALLRQAQGYTIEELARWVEECRGAVCEWFMVDTFEHLKRGGRVNGATAAVGTMLQIKPLMHVSAQGRLEVADRTVRGPAGPRLPCCTGYRRAGCPRPAPRCLWATGAAPSGPSCRA